MLLLLCIKLKGKKSNVIEQVAVVSVEVPFSLIFTEAFLKDYWLICPQNKITIGQEARQLIFSISRESHLIKATLT